MTQLTGKISWFGGPRDAMDSGVTASGIPESQPGIAVYNRATLRGYWRIKMPNGRVVVLQQTDIGPAPWTGRVMDFLYSALPECGYTESNFPTDATITAEFLGMNPGASMKSIEDFVRLCIAQTGKPYVWGAAGPNEFDCSGLVMWACHQLGATAMPHYSGSQFDICKRITIAEAVRVRGALLFEGPGGSQHVVVVRDPNVRTIEARGRAYGVGSWEIQGRPWSGAALIPWFSYSLPHSSGPIPWPGVMFQLKKPNMTGEGVKWIQQQLTRHGFRVTVDADFGPLTAHAVQQFQHSQHITEDGVVGPDTWGRLGK